METGISGIFELSKSAPFNYWNFWACVCVLPIWRCRIGKFTNLNTYLKLSNFSNAISPFPKAFSVHCSLFQWYRDYIWSRVDMLRFMQCNAITLNQLQYSKKDYKNMTCALLSKPNKQTDCSDLVFFSSSPSKITHRHTDTCTHRHLCIRFVCKSRTRNCIRFSLLLEISARESSIPATFRYPNKSQNSGNILLCTVNIKILVTFAYVDVLKFLDEN